ncbi:MAG: HEPN domain-containing protein [Paludibacteraceae bacterium]|nr:HEPN domain-containing protein [Paludibacteraceae bacterium]
MTTEEKIQYWLDIADYDLDTAEAMYKTGRWLYVAFMCHQVIEKTLKAYWCKTQSEDAPYTHNLILLANQSGLADMMSDEQNLFLARIMPMNIAARYPSYKDQLSKMLDKNTCRLIIDNTQQLQVWIKNKL